MVSRKLLPREHKDSKLFLWGTRPSATPFLGASLSIRVTHSHPHPFHCCQWPKEKLWPESPLNKTQMILYYSCLFPEERTFSSGCEGKEREGGCLFLFDPFWRRESNAGLEHCLTSGLSFQLAFGQIPNPQGWNATNSNRKCKLGREMKIKSWSVILPSHANARCSNQMLVSQQPHHHLLDVVWLFCSKYKIKPILYFG